MAQTSCSSSSRGDFAAVVFDLGGVVFESPIGALRRLEIARGLPINSVNKRIAKSPAWNLVEQGKISVPEFVERFDKENATDVAAGCISQKLADVCGLDVISAIASVRATPRKYFAKAISALRQAGLLVVALTNNFKETGDASLANVVTPMFDHVIESSKVGCRKPETRIYEITCERIGVPPEKCVFLDDIGANLKSAKAYGWTTIRVLLSDTNGVEALRQLQHLVGVDLQLPADDREAPIDARHAPDAPERHQLAIRQNTHTQASKL